MSFDVPQSGAIAQGEVWTPPPIALEGMHVNPPSVALSTQVTGDDVTTLRAACTGGRVKIYGRVRDLIAEEVAVAVSQGGNYLVAGEAVWFAKVAVQHTPNGAIDVVYVPGAIAVVANVAKTTDAEIIAFLDLGDDGTYVICGDIRFHRSADTVIDSQVSDTRRPAYVDQDDKTELLADQTDNSNLGERFWGYLDFAIDLTTAHGLGAGVLMVDSAELPSFPFGGRLGAMKYIGAVAAAGVGADIDLRLGIDGTPVTGGILNLLLAGCGVPSTVAEGAEPTALADFNQGDGLDIEVDEAATAFTAGSGTIRVGIYEKVRR